MFSAGEVRKSYPFSPIKGLSHDFKKIKLGSSLPKEKVEPFKIALSSQRISCKVSPVGLENDFKASNFLTQLKDVEYDNVSINKTIQKRNQGKY